MALYAIADLHLSLGTNKPMDVFPNWKDYVARIEKNWRALVEEKDTVVIAGDISWAMQLRDSAKDFAFLHSLPGKKLILKGNHDYWWSTRKKMEAFFEEQGFTSLQIVHNSSVIVEGRAVCGTRGWLYNSASEEDRKIVSREAGRLTASLEEARRQGAEPIVFLHYPPVYDTMECAEILEILEKWKIRDCYFGHIHGTEAARRAVQGEYRGTRLHLVACDFVNFTPVLVR